MNQQANSASVAVLDEMINDEGRPIAGWKQDRIDNYLQSRKESI